MKAPLTLGEVLEGAIGKEMASQQLYSELSRRVKEPAARDAFRGLVVEEERHQHWLERYQRGEVKGALGRRQAVDYRIAEHFDQPEMSPGMKLADVFLLAANREKSSHELYLSLARLHPAGEVRALFEDMAAQELGHKQKVEALYTEVAFPQTDGG
ncbi:MAG: ferritin family protein [Chloroflexota bacterium]